MSRSRLACLWETLIHADIIAGFAINQFVLLLFASPAPQSLMERCWAGSLRTAGRAGAPTDLLTARGSGATANQLLVEGRRRLLAL